ncbi:MAG: hypothetical protein GX660_02810 [Clostridiaceae bacterium]|nr:hypothetical protein [Clostridiaceae bacterium]
MGVTISSKRYSCDMGYSGFNRFRQVVADKVNNEFADHYKELASIDVIMLGGEKRKEYFEKYDAKTIEFVNSNVITAEVANFLYQSDCTGKIDRKQAKEIYELIKDCDDNIIFGYTGRKDCAKMYDMKNIFSDRTKVEWC